MLKQVLLKRLADLNPGIGDPYPSSTALSCISWLVFSSWGVVIVSGFKCRVPRPPHKDLKKRKMKALSVMKCYPKMMVAKESHQYRPSENAVL